MKPILMAAAACLVASTPAFAGSIDLSQTLKGANGKPAMECREPGSAPNTCAKVGTMTLGAVVFAAVRAGTAQGSSLDALMKRGRLERKISDDTKAVDLTAEEITMIKDGLPKVPIDASVALDVVERLDPAAAKN